MFSSAVDVGRRLAELLAGREGDSRLDLLALQLAQVEYPQLSVAHYVSELDRLAARVTVSAAEAREPAPNGVVSAINRCLFEEEGFRGNIEEYYDPRNSFLNDVLDRRTGLPILLSTVYIEVGRRLGFEVRGVGLPGHFVVRVAGPTDLLVDPFNGGALLTLSDCERRLREIYGPDMRMESGFLDPVSNKYIITRILNNLRSMYLNSRLYRKVIDILDVLLEIYPVSAEDYKQRALLQQQLKNYSRAVADYEGYLRVASDASDADDVRQTVLGLKRLLASMN